MMSTGTKRKLPAKFAQPAVRVKQANTARTPPKQIAGEARAVVGNAALDQDTQSPSAQLKNGDTIEISSDEESLDDDSEIDEENTANFHAEDTEMKDGEDKEEGEASFGDLVLAHTSEPINVKEAFPGEKRSEKRDLVVPTGASLGVALSQALKTSDHALLESCLQTSDLATIRATIQRLAPPLASSLLTLLAARLHRRPGRAGSLMVWIQWTLVTHGGYLATQPSLIVKLAELNRVVEERARGLQGLLALKGKLDLLDAQMMLRRSVRDARNRDEEEEEDEDVIYVEGEEDVSEDEEVPGVKVNGAKNMRERYEDSEGSESEGEMPDTFGEMEVDSEDEDEDSDGALVDDEAESTDDDESEEEEVDFEDADEEEESEDEAAIVGGQTPGRTPKAKARR